MSKEILQERMEKNAIESEQEILDIFFKDSIGQYINSKVNEVSGDVSHEIMIQDALENINNFLDGLKEDAKGLENEKVEKIITILKENLPSYVEKMDQDINEILAQEEKDEDSRFILKAAEKYQQNQTAITVDDLLKIEDISQKTKDISQETLQELVENFYEESLSLFIQAKTANAQSQDKTKQIAIEKINSRVEKLEKDAEKFYADKVAGITNNFFERLVDVKKPHTDKVKEVISILNVPNYVEKMNQEISKDIEILASGKKGDDLGFALLDAKVLYEFKKPVPSVDDLLKTRSIIAINPEQFNSFFFKKARDLFVLEKMK